MINEDVLNRLDEEGCPKCTLNERETLNKLSMKMEALNKLDEGGCPKQTLNMKKGALNRLNEGRML